MNKKKIAIISSSIAVLLVIAIVACVFLFNKPQQTDTTPLVNAYQKTTAQYFGKINTEKLQSLLPNSDFSILCGEEQSSHFLIKTDKKQMVNILNSKNEFSEKTVDMQFYIFDERFALSSNELLGGHLYGFDTEVIDLQLKHSSLFGMQGIDAEAVLKNNQQKLNTFRTSAADMWLIGQTNISDTLSSAKAKCEETEAQRVERYELNAEQAKQLTSTFFGAPASVLRYLARHTEYLLFNDDVYAYQTLIDIMYEIADIAECAENANEVIFTINKTSGLLESIRFESANEFADIQFEQNDGVGQIRLAASKDPELTLDWVLLNADNGITHTVNRNGEKIFSGSITETETETGFKLSVNNILTANEMKQIDVAFALTENINETMELPAYIDIGNMDIEATQHFFEHMSNAYAEGYDEFANILIFNAEAENETDFIEVPKENIYQGEIILVDNDQMTAKIVKIDTETIYPGLVFEMSNKTEETLYFMTQGMLIQNQTIDINTGMDVPAGETRMWAIQLTKDFLGFNLEEIDSMYFPRITISTSDKTLLEISHTVEFSETENTPVTELPKMVVYNAAHFKVYAEKDIVITDDGIQTTVYFANNSSRNIYIDINAGIINDVRGECLEYFSCHAKTICKKTLTIKGDFADIAEEDIQKIIIELYIRDRDQSQLTGLQHMEIHLADE